VRRYFADEKKAARFGASMRAKHSSGHRGALIPAELAMQAAAAQKVLEPLGISLIEAARIVAAQEGAAEGREIFKDRYMRMMIDGEERWSDRYRTDMDKIPRWIGKAGMKMTCAELTGPVIDSVLRQHGAKALTTLALRRRMVLAVLNHHERLRGAKRDVCILTPAQAARVLRAAETGDQRRVVGLLLWAGIRPDAEHGEISRLCWDAVGETEIYVSFEVSKVGDRHVPITPRLRRLLRGHPETGPVVPAGWRRAWQRIRKEAGIADLQDVTRHTFASNMLAAFGEDAAKQAMGHTEGSRTLFRHYRRAVTEAAGRKYFGAHQP
jgi:integrase